MPFEVEKEATQAPNGAITTDRRLFLTEDQKTLVEEGDVKARIQLAAPGHQIPAAEVKRLGLHVHNGRVEQGAKAKPDEDDSGDTGDEKQREPAGDKQRHAGENKAGKKK